MLKKIILFCTTALLLSACTTTVTTRAPAKHNLTIQHNLTAAGYNVQLGMAYLQQGDVQRAKSKLLLAHAQAPTWAPANDALAYYFETTGDMQKAQHYYVKAVDINPKAGAPQNNYGTFLCRTGHYQQAEQHFIIATQDTNYINTAAAYENAGLCALKIPDTAKATGYFQQAIKQDPRRATSFLELAQLDFKQNNIAQAQQDFNQYLQLTPNLDAEALWLGIRLARAMHNSALASSYILQLQNKYPNSFEYRQLRASQPLPQPKV